MNERPSHRVDATLQKLAPPQVGPFRDDAFRSPLHSVRVASILGIALGITFSVCFITGFTSHLIQHPPS
ncbi:MAG: molybdopterin-binding protein, partial [Myxococcota bacterium]